MPGSNSKPCAAFVIWTESCSVGDAALDAQHQSVIRLLNELYNSIHQKNDIALLASTLAELEQYTRTHFAAEEDILVRCGYPDLKAHQLQHARMINRTAALRHAFQGKQEGLSLSVLEFLKDWWLTHIRACDKEYALFLHQHLLLPSTEAGAN